MHLFAVKEKNSLAEKKRERRRIEPATFRWLGERSNHWTTSVQLSQQATFVHIATNSIQSCWQLSADGASRQVKPLWCASCNAAMTLTHLAECADNAVFRFNQRVAVLIILSSFEWTQDWVDSRRQLPLTELLVELFPQPADTPLHPHITRIMCGVFSTRQANAALKALGCTRAQDGRKLMLELRLCLVDGVQTFFHVLKEALP